jgi:hypothetical protein
MFEFEEIIPNKEVQAKLDRLMALFKKAKIEQVFNDPMFADALKSEAYRAYLETTYLLDTTKHN